MPSRLKRQAAGKHRLATFVTDFDGDRALPPAWQFLASNVCKDSAYLAAHSLPRRYFLALIITDTRT